MAPLGRAIMLSTPGDSASFSVPGGGHLRLIMVEHAWSGIVEVKVARRSYSVDLYSPEQRHRTFEVPLPRIPRVTVTVTVTGHRHPDSQAQQAWIYAAYVTSDQSPLERLAGRALELARTIPRAGQHWRLLKRPGTAVTPGLHQADRSAPVVPAVWTPDGSNVVPVGDRLVFVRGQEGDMLTLTNDVGISNDIRTVGTWAARDVALFKKLIAPGSFVMDIGANLGHHTIVFSRAAGNDGLVVACEPQRVMFALLETNLFLSGCHNAETVRCALGDKPGQVTMWPADYGAPTNFGAVGVFDQRSDWTPERAGETVDLTTVDDLLASYRQKGRRVSFVKIDVQAFELPCLLGATDMLADDRPTIFLEISPYWMQHLVGYDYRDIYRLLWDHEYEIFEPHQSLTEATGIREWSGEQLEEWDILAVPKSQSGTKETQA